MAQRVFRDQGGVEWVVVDVLPDVGNRRAGADRRRSTAPEVVVERRQADRRVRARPRVLLGSDLERGWLYFQTDTQTVQAPELARRRLAPIPPGWESLPEQELALLLDRARQVARTGPTRLDRMTG